MMAAKDKLLRVEALDRCKQMLICIQVNMHTARNSDKGAECPHGKYDENGRYYAQVGTTQVTQAQHIEQTQ